MAEKLEGPRSQAETDLLGFLDGLDSEGEGSRAKLIGENNWTRYNRIYRGRSWADRTKSPFFEANLVGAQIERKVAVLGEGKPELKTTPRREGLTATAEILEKTIRAGWDEQNVPLAYEAGLYHLQVFGCMVFQITWDRFADYGRGDIVVNAVDPRNFIMDPAVQFSYDSDKAQYQRVSTLVPLWELQRRFPGRGQAVKADPRNSLVADEGPQKQGQWASLRSSVANWSGRGARSSGPIPRAWNRSYWFNDPALGDDGELKYPFGRCVLRAGDVILEDRKLEYFDGAWPNIMVDGRVDLDHPWGRSEVEGLRRLQEAINRIGHMFVANTIATGNTWVIADADALGADVMAKLNNLEAVILEKRLGRNIERIPPPQMPPHMLGFIDAAAKLMDLLSGNEGLVTGRGRVELRSGDMIEGLQQASQILIRAMARRVEGLFERLGQKWISRIFQYYTDDRLMTWLAGESFETFTFERQSLMEELSQQAQKEIAATQDSERQKMISSGAIWPQPNLEDQQGKLQDAIRDKMIAAYRDFRFKVTPYSSLATTKMRRAMMKAELAKNGIGSRLAVLRELGYENPEEELKQAMHEAQEFGGAPGQDPKKGGGGGGSDDSGMAVGGS